MLYYLTANYVTSTLMVYQSIVWLMFSTLFVSCTRANYVARRSVAA
jgi:hypothetical protein